MTRKDLRRRATGCLVAVTAGLCAVSPATAASAGPAPGAPTDGVGTVLHQGAAGTVPDSYIVVLRAGPAPAGPSAALAAASELSRRYGGVLHTAYTSAVRGFSVRMSAAGARRLAANPAVAYVEQDRIVSLAAVQTDPTWGLDRLDQRDLPLSRSYASDSAAGVTAYIIDTGIRTAHVDFGGRARNGWDFDSRPDPDDCNGHGTHVAGTVGGARYGVAKNVKLVGVRVLDCQGSGTYSQVIKGVDWVTAHAVKPAVANMSLGGPASRALDDAVRRSISSGVGFVLAAGNDNANACLQSPARVPTAITVGSTDRADARSSFSNYGSCLDIFAPGSAITSAGHAGNTAATTMSGTSMAAPHVAGAAALVLGASPGSTPAQVRDALVARASTGRLTRGGAGSPDRLLFTGSAPLTPAPPAAPPAPASCDRFTAGSKLMMADLSTVTSRLTVAGCPGTASAATTVEVHVKHGHRGSLVLELIAPDGTRYPLKAATTADRANNLDATYVVDAAASPRDGIWGLRVRDAYRRHTGYLHSWTLRP
jgi:subtilisin family serine protease